jgi:competence protein ComEC
LDVGRNSLAGFGGLNWRVGPELTRNRLLVACSLLLAFCSFSIQYAAARPIAIDNAVSDYSTVPSLFEVLDEPRKFGATNNFRVNIRLLKAEISAQEHHVFARGELRGGIELKKLEPKAKYSCLLSLLPSSSAERAGFHSNCQDRSVEQTPAPIANQVVRTVRNKFLANLKGVTGDSAGLVAGLAIGDTSQISSQLIANMKTVSLTHLTAVSGANCAIVLALVYVLIKRLGGGKWARLLIGLITLVCYVALVGPQPSVLRAAVMAGAVLTAISLGRRSSAISALSLAIIILLIADPWLATDYGFALSVAATAGLLLLTQPLALKLHSRLPKWLAVSLSVAIAAQIFCLPILLQLQSGLSTYSLPANLLAEPLVAPITVLGILALITAIPFPVISGGLSYLASLGAELIVRIASWLSSLPSELIPWPVGFDGAAAALCVVAAFLLWLKAKSDRVRNLGILVLAIILAISIGSLSFLQIRSAAWPLDDWQVVACDVGQGDAIVIRSNELIAVIDVGREDKLVDECLSRLGVVKIDLLVLTHFDMDHVGGIRGALEGRSVKRVMLSPFKDDRWGATGTNLYLQTTGAQTTFAEKGMSGTFGSFSWSVLSPNRLAQGAEDSNDASVVMLWSAPEYNLLTMADIGEKGQMRMVSQSSWWKTPKIHEVPLILKVAHHGSGDQYFELLEALKPDLSLISVGKENSYGHPTARVMVQLQKSGSALARTDELGSIALSVGDSGIILSNSPRLTG